MATNFGKIRTFNGKIARKWMPPSDYRRWVTGANKLLKLYYRIKNSGLLYPDLVTKLQEATEAWRRIGDLHYKEKIDNQYYVEFDEIKEFNVQRFLAFQKNIKELLGEDKVDIFVEETRNEEVGTHCNLCKVNLKKPAYIVHRLGPDEIYRSNPIGVMCLHNCVGKLDKVLELPQLASIVRDINEVVEYETNSTLHSK